VVQFRCRNRVVPETSTVNEEEYSIAAVQGRSSDGANELLTAARRSSDSRRSSELQDWESKSNNFF